MGDTIYLSARGVSCLAFLINIPGPLSSNRPKNTTPLAIEDILLFASTFLQNRIGLKLKVPPDVVVEQTDSAQS